MSSKSEIEIGSGGGDNSPGISPCTVSTTDHGPVTSFGSGQGPGPGSESTSPKKIDQKVCGVCSDKALGYNFNAITCESCKAFFRRNALKKKEFKCPFSDNCKVDVVTRRFCQKCRLKKCFHIGMKKEWIMTDEEKTIKKRKIEENRHKRHPEDPQATSNICTKPHARVSAMPHGSQSQEALASETSSSEYDSLLSPASASTGGRDQFSPLQPEGTSVSIECSPRSESVPSPASSKDSKIRFFNPKAFRTHELSDDVFHSATAGNEMVNNVINVAYKAEMCKDSSSGSQSGTMSPCSPSGDRAEEATTRLDCFGELAEKDRNLLQELIVANKAMKAPFTNDDKVGSRADPPLINVINLTDLAIRRLIKMCKKINGFKSLCQEDQIALLKGSCTELMILRSVMTYNPVNECWQGPKGPKEMKIKLDVLREANGNVYEEHKRFLHSFEKEWRTDENVMLILGAITLFSPDRPNVVHRDLILHEQDSYYSLLQRYLSTVYSGCESRSVFVKLKQRITELHHLNENHVRVYLDVNPKEVAPLLIEIFDPLIR